MSLVTYEKALAVIRGDADGIILCSITKGELTPDVLRSNLLFEVDKLGLWIWDTFNFETMTIPQAIRMESENRVISDPSIFTDYPIKSVGYTLAEHGAGFYKYDVVVVDDEADSSFANSLMTKFKMQLKETSESGGKYYYYYELLST